MCADPTLVRPTSAWKAWCLVASLSASLSEAVGQYRPDGQVFRRVATTRPAGDVVPRPVEPGRGILPPAGPQPTTTGPATARYKYFTSALGN
jgi:hypothetical protein